MDASANHPGSHGNNSNANTNIGCSGGTNKDSIGAAGNKNGDGLSATENSVTGTTHPRLRHNPGVALDWSSEEQAVLENLLMKYAGDIAIFRYAKIAQALENKTVRDVALRCRWMNKKENGKKRKDDQSLSKKSNKKENAMEPLPKSSQVTNWSTGPPHVSSMILADCDDGISYNRIGGAFGKLLEQNTLAMDQISANFQSLQVYDNIGLFYHARNNILSILNDCIDMPEAMKQMPPLSVKLNEELVNTFLLPASMPR